MCYREHSAVLKGRAHSSLDELIRLHVNRCRGLVHDEDLGLPQHGTHQAHQLSLAHTKHRLWNQSSPDHFTSNKHPSPKKMSPPTVPSPKTRLHFKLGVENNKYNDWNVFTQSSVKMNTESWPFLELGDQQFWPRGVNNMISVCHAKIVTSSCGLLRHSCSPAHLWDCPRSPPGGPAPAPPRSARR